MKTLFPFVVIILLLFVCQRIRFYIQWADIFTKLLTIERFDFIKKNLNMHFVSEYYLPLNENSDSKDVQMLRSCRLSQLRLWGNWASEGHQTLNSKSPDSLPLIAALVKKMGVTFCNICSTNVTVTLILSLTWFSAIRE